MLLSRISCSGEKARKREGIVAIYILSPYQKKKKKEEKRKCFSYLKSILELNRDVPDVLRDLMLIAIDFTGL